MVTVVGFAISLVLSKYKWIKLKKERMQVFFFLWFFFGLFSISNLEAVYLYLKYPIFQFTCILIGLFLKQ